MLRFHYSLLDKAWRFGQALLRRVTPAGLLALAALVLAGAAGIDTELTLAYQLFGYASGLLLVGFLPFVLRWIPTSALAAILVYTGYKLVNPPNMKKMWETSRAEFGVFATTIVAIVATDLLTGVLIGFGLALAKMLYNFLHLNIVKEISEDGKSVDIALDGAATFVHLPRIAEQLESIDDKLEVHFHLGSMIYADHSILELVNDWRQRRGGEVFMEWDIFHSRVNAQVSLANHGIGSRTGQGLQAARKTMTAAAMATATVAAALPVDGVVAGDVSAGSDAAQKVATSTPNPGQDA